VRSLSHTASGRTGNKAAVCIAWAVGLFLAASTTAGAAVVGAHGAVAAEHRLASEAGVEILENGGNAVDAAVAVSLVSGLVNPASAGLGGGGFMIVYLAQEGRAHAIDYREAAPGQATRNMFVRNGVVQSEASTKGGLAVAVPGEPAGLELVLKRFGTMTMAEVAAPALKMARYGFTVEAHLARALEKYRDSPAADPALAKEFLRPDGSAPKEGETLTRPGLAATLELLSREGAAPFYKGEIAAKTVAAVQKAGGILTRSDLGQYRVVQRPPVVARYKDWRLVAMPPPSSGGGTIATALGVLGTYPLGDLGHNSSTYLHLVAETMKAVFAERAAFYGDPDFVDVPLASLMSQGNVEKIRERFRSTRPVPPSAYGNVTTRPDSGTAHISVVDVHGNAVACTTSINTPFGSKVGVPGTGIVLNNTMDDFSLRPGAPNVYGLVGSEANSIAPGKRPLSSMSPTVILKNGKPRLVVGASGGPLIITATLQTILNNLEFSMSLEDAVGAARIHHQWAPDRLAVEQALDKGTRESLQRLGHDVRVFPISAAVQAVEVRERGGVREVRAVSDRRKGGVAAAY
jgi:gamma-glutamyltranspeptidase/glutathione hydrolase